MKKIMLLALAILIGGILVSVIHSVTGFPPQSVLTNTYYADDSLAYIAWGIVIGLAIAA